MMNDNSNNNAKLYVGNVNYETEEGELRDFFNEKISGTIKNISFIRDGDTGRFKGFAFIEYEDPENAEKAAEEMNGMEFKGRKLIVNKAVNRERRNNNY